MSDAVVITKLSVIGTIKEGIGLGAKNMGPILVNALLWMITCWIPYLNVGTTIGLFTGVIAKSSKGEAISFTEIFNPDYRKFMGEFFLTSGLMAAGIAAASLLMLIPGMVICLAWSQALLLVIDKGKNPTEALVLSNKCTYGNKWRMVWIFALQGLAIGIVCGILGAISGAIHVAAVSFIFGLIMFGVILFAMFVSIGVQASIYKQLTANV